MTFELRDAGAGGSSERPGSSGLSWGILSRFTRYVRDSGGLISASGGAVIDATGMPSWPLVDDSDFDDGSGILRFGGSVHCSAHFGALDLPVSDPEVRVGEGRGELRIPTPGDPTSWMPLAEFAWRETEVAHGTRAWVGLEVALAPSAVPLFGGNYPAGMPLDPLIVVLAHGNR